MGIDLDRNEQGYEPVAGLYEDKIWADTDDSKSRRSNQREVTTIAQRLTDLRQRKDILDDDEIALLSAHHKELLGMLNQTVAEEVTRRNNLSAIRATWSRRGPGKP